LPARSVATFVSEALNRPSTAVSLDAAIVQENLPPGTDGEQQRQGDNQEERAAGVDSHDHCLPNFESCETLVIR
jgi:hypothetical protein